MMSHFLFFISITQPFNHLILSFRFIYFFIAFHSGHIFNWFVLCLLPLKKAIITMYFNITF